MVENVVEEEVKEEKKLKMAEVEEAEVQVQVEKGFRQRSWQEMHVEKEDVQEYEDGEKMAENS